MTITAGKLIKIYVLLSGRQQSRNCSSLYKSCVLFVIKMFGRAEDNVKKESDTDIKHYRRAGYGFSFFFCPR